MEDAREIRYPISPTAQLVLTRQPRAATRVNVSAARVAACNEVVAQMCDRLIVGSPNRSRIDEIELLARGPVMRFAHGPLMRPGADGSHVEDGEVLHMWEDRRQR